MFITRSSYIKDEGHQNSYLLLGESVMKTAPQIIHKLRSPDNNQALQAVEELRVRGQLEDGTLVGINLRFVHLSGADLYKADLRKADFGMADLRWADLSLANLRGARLTKANLYKADFSRANLRGANLFRANLQEARNLTDDQLALAYRLWDAIMPDGSRYDGRFNLPGDRAFSDFECADTGERNIPALTGNETKAQLIRKLRSPDNQIVLQAVKAMQKRGWLREGILDWVQLRYVHLQQADLRQASLHKTDLRMADLQGADLSEATLHGARLSGANLQEANLSKAHLQGAILSKANLRGACNLTDWQLAQSGKLRGAMLPDGRRYDGRFNLVGDLGDAYFLHIDVDEPAAMADFYGVSIGDFLLGQAWARKFVPDGSTALDHIERELVLVDVVG
jgi:uncharacterized protein YjbI with pentapeptide repeats